LYFADPESAVRRFRLRNHAGVNGPATDFAHEWGLNVGLSALKARRLAPAVDEIQFPNKGSGGQEFRLVQHVEARHIVDRPTVPGKTGKSGNSGHDVQGEPHLKCGAWLLDFFTP
jgi:hypothetical protein